MLIYYQHVVDNILHYIIIKSVLTYIARRCLTFYGRKKESLLKKQHFRCNTLIVVSEHFLPKM